MSTIPALGEVKLTAGAVVNVGGGNQPVIYSGTEPDYRARNASIGSAAAVTGRPGGGGIQLQARNLHLGEHSRVDTTSVDLVPGQGGGRSGDLNLLVKGSVEVLGGSTVVSTTFGTGDAGDIYLKAGSVMIDNQGALFLNGIGNQSLAGRIGGAAGKINIETGDLQIWNHPGGGYSAIASRSFGAKAPADIQVTADHILLNGQQAKGVNSFYLSPLTVIASITLGPGVGIPGNVVVQADKIEILNSANFDTYNKSLNKGGEVNVHAREIFIGGPFVEGVFRSTINAVTAGPGDGGKIVVTADLITLDHGSISAGANPLSTGNGGDVIVNAHRIVLQRMGEIDSHSDLKGNGGNLSVTADELLIDARTTDPIYQQFGTSISAQAQGAGQHTGKGGEVHVSAGQIEMFGPTAVITSETTRSEPGGKVTIDAGRLTLAEGANITSASYASGDSGSVLVRVQGPLVLNDGSSITTQAKVGNAHSLTVQSGSVIELNGGSITAQAAQSGGEVRVNGIISVLGPSVDLTGSLTTLPASLLAPGSPLPEQCGLKLGSDLSSFLVLGRGGIPLQPGGWQPSYGAARRPHD